MADGTSEPPPRDDLDRRRFLTYGAASLAAAAGLASFVSLQFLQPWDRERVHGALVVGYPEEIPEGAVLLFPGQQVAVGRTAQGLYALSTVCPHLGCVVQWLEEDQRFHCPCHGSRFEPQGRVLNGPAREDLIPVAMGLDGQGRLVVDPRQTADATGLEV